MALTNFVPSNKSMLVNNHNNFDTQGSLVSVRVLKCILDPTLDKDYFDRFGEYASIGTIMFEYVEFPTKQKDSTYFYAKPLFSNIKQYPLENEIVLIINSADTTTGYTTQANTYYYLLPVNVWNSQHHNAVPDEHTSKTNLVAISQQKSVFEVEAGSKSTTTNNTLKIQLGYGFTEQPSIRPLKPLAGDITLEGRFGNSLRFGATNKVLENPWSKTGKNGDPIIILRNGQYEDSSLEGWIPTYEDVNKDASSMYFTSTQQINIENESFSDASFPEDSKPTKLNFYNKPQIIASSNKIVLNAKEDGVVLVAKKNIHLTGQTINIDALSNFTIESQRINLGSHVKSLLQPTLRGNSTEELLKGILQILTKLTNACAKANAGGVPVQDLNLIAPLCLQVLQGLSTENIKSKDVFTI